MVVLTLPRSQSLTDLLDEVTVEHKFHLLKEILVLATCIRTHIEKSNKKEKIKILFLTICYLVTILKVNIDK